jgi:hypothetical protein
VSDEIRAWVDVVADAVARAVAGERDLLALKVAAVFPHEPVMIAVPRRAVLAAAPHVGMRSAIERYHRRPIPLLALLDERGAVAWRAFRVSNADYVRVADALQARLASMHFAGDVVPLVCTVDDVAWWLAERHLAPDRLAALGLAPEPILRLVPRSGDALAELLEANGIQRSLVERSKWGLAIVSGGVGESRLGGRPMLEDRWPLHNGRPLTHLASIALAELPDFEDRDLLPREGTLVFFADFIDEVQLNARVIYVPPGAGQLLAPPQDARDQRDVPVELNERRVRFQPVLTLAIPRDLRDADHEALRDVDELLESADHLLLGHPVYIQDNPPEDGQISLLQLNWDEPLNFMYGDGGQITFHGAPHDIHAGRWNRLSAQLDSS